MERHTVTINTLRCTGIQETDVVGRDAALFAVRFVGPEAKKERTKGGTRHETNLIAKSVSFHGYGSPTQAIAMAAVHALGGDWLQIKANRLVRMVVRMSSECVIPHPK